MRSIGLDVHRDFCEVAIAEGGKAVRRAGRDDAGAAELFARSLGRDDRVVLEATGNALAIARILEPHVGEVVVAHSKQVRAISHARGEVRQGRCAHVGRAARGRSDPAVWVGDERTRVLRRRVSRRRGAGQAVDGGQERSFGGAGAQPEARPAGRICSARRAGPGSGPWSCPSTSARRSTAACASSTSWQTELAGVDRAIAEAALGSTRSVG